MALTITPVRTFVSGDRRTVIADITFDSSYATGGETLAASDLGLTTTLNSVAAQAANGGNTFSYDYTNAKLLAFSGGSQVASTTDLSAVTTRVVAIGKGPGL